MLTFVPNGSYQRPILWVATQRFSQPKIILVSDIRQQSWKKAFNDPCPNMASVVHSERGGSARVEHFK